MEPGRESELHAQLQDLKRNLGASAAMVDRQRVRLAKAEQTASEASTLLAATQKQTRLQVLAANRAQRDAELLLHEAGHALRGELEPDDEARVLYAIEHYFKTRS